VLLFAFLGFHPFVVLMSQAPQKAEPMLFPDASGGDS
jgi:hypothetical protein